MKSIILFMLVAGVAFAIGYSLVSPTIKSPISSDKKSILKESTKLFSLERAPSKTLRGKLTSIIGVVKIQTRLATEPATLSTVKEIQQGEVLATGEDGSLNVDFENGARIRISSDSNIEFVQTLPEHIVMIQHEGTIQYESKRDALVSVRSMHLVADISKNSDLVLEKEAERLTFTVKKGSVNVAFNNLENVTSIATIREGETYVFNDDTREGELE